jgi:lysophospholipase
MPASRRLGWLLSLVIASVVLAGAGGPSDAAEVDGFTITTTAELGGVAARDIEEFWKPKDTRAPETFVGQRGLNLAYVTFVQADRAAEKGAIVIVSGRTEAYLKYKELIFDLWRNGYSVYTYDHRGQGLSDREPEVASEPERGYVNSFDDFVSDLDTFVRTKVAPGNHANYFLVAHSMGGAIAAQYLERSTDPGIRFRAAAFSSPMMEIKGLFGLSGDLLSCHGARVLKSLGLSTRYVLGGSGYSPKPFAKNSYTSSPLRYQRLLDEYEKTPKVRLGSATHGWVALACDAARQARRDGAKIQIPVRLFQAGADTIVHPAGQREFCANYRKTRSEGCDGAGGGPITVADAKHELFIEDDAKRNQVLTTTLKFFESQRQR